MNPVNKPANGELRLTPQNPWPGLAAFTAANCEFFYGREAEIAEIFRRVRRQMLTVLFGVSGLGKTSLLQAGLLPKLGGTPFHPILIRLDHGAAAEDLIEQVRSAINREVEPARRAGIKVPRGPAQREDLWGYLHDKTTDWIDPKGDAVNPVLVFDQFEEIFTREAGTREMEERRQRFMELLANLVENRPPEALARGLDEDADFARRYDFRQEDYRVVISLREDFLAHLESYKQRMPSLMENRMRLKPMTEEQALQAVLGPGREIVEEPVAREIVAFVCGKARGTQPTKAPSSASFETAAAAEADPVLLSLVCDQLNRRRLERNQARITADLLTAEREGIIQEFYEQAFRGMDAKVREWVEDELLTASGYRNRAAQEDALHAGVPVAALDELGSGRILHREERGGVVWLELTHDLLTGPATTSRKAREQRLAEAAAAKREAALKAERDEQQRKARRSARISRSLAAALVGLVALAWWYWDGHLREHIRYFHSFTKRYGVAHGVGQLTADQAAHRSVSYRFVYQGRRGPLLRMEAVDAAGRLTTRHGAGTYLKYASEDQNPDRECQWEFARDSRGRVVHETALNRRGEVVWAFAYSPQQTNDFRRRAHFVGPSGMPLAQRNSSAEYVDITYDANGYEQRVAYLDHLGHPQSGPDGQYGEFRRFDTRGNALSRTSLNTNGLPMVDEAGNSTQDTVYDLRDFPISNYATVLTNLDGPPRRVLWKGGYHKRQAEWDAYGRIVRERFFDLQGQPVLSRDGYASATFQYDERGNEIGRAYFDTNGASTLNTWNYHRMEMRYDGRGNLTNWIVFDTAGRRAPVGDGYSQVATRFDENDREVERSFLDANGQPMRVGFGYARWTRRYDAQSRMLEESYFDEAGQPRRGVGRYARVVFSYDVRGNRVSEEYFDAENRAMKGGKNFASLTAEYDERGNRIAEAYFDEFKLPVRHENGFARRETRYDSRGNAIEEVYYDENGSRVRLPEGYSRITRRYDDRTNCVEEAYFDEQNQPVLQEDSVAKKLFRYDERGNRIEESFRDAADQPVECKAGYARKTIAYGPYDLWTEARLYDLRGELRLPNKGNAIGRARYDDRRRNIELSYHDPAGKLRAWNGWARTSKAFNHRGDLIEERYFDAEGQPAIESEMEIHARIRAFDHRGNWTNEYYLGANNQKTRSSAGFAEEVRTYDAGGRLIEHRWFDEQGRPTPGTRGDNRVTERFALRYDEQDNIVEELYLDGDGRLVRSDYGYARLTSRYNDRSQRFERAFWDEHTNLVAGVARTVSRYDERGNELEYGCFDALGRPTINGDRLWHKWVKTFDHAGRRTNLSFFDLTTTNLIADNHGIARETAAYDDRGKLVETAWFDADDERVNGTNGYARFAARYDDRGNQIERAFFSPHGTPVSGPDGYARYTARFNPQGRRLEASYFYDPQNRRRVVNGYARVTIVFDERGNQIRWACFNEIGEPVLDREDGAHMVETTYDELGRKVSLAQFGRSGQLIQTKGGFPRVEYRYDAAGNLAEKLYFDADSEPLHSETYYAREVLTFDDRGRKTEGRYFYDLRSSVWQTNGYALARASFDQRGNIISWAFFDTNGAPTVDRQAGHHAYTKEYDANDYYTNQVFLDVNRAKIVTADGYARTTVRRDAKGRELEAFFFDDQDQPAHAGDAEWHRVTHYNEQGQKVETRFEYTTNSPVFLERGYRQSVIRYNTKGKAVRWACFDAASQPVLDGPVGYHAWTKAYDTRGNLTNQVFLGTDGRRMPGRAGYAETRSTFDSRNRLLSLAYFGARGEPVNDLESGVHLTRRSYDDFGNWTNLIHFDIGGQITTNMDGYAQYLRRFNELGELVFIRFLDAQGNHLARRQAITGVVAGGEGEHLGLRPGDVILSYAGKSIEVQPELLRLVTKPGTEPRELTVRRAGQVLTFKARPGLLGIQLKTVFEAQIAAANTPSS